MIRRCLRSRGRWLGAPASSTCVTWTEEGTHKPGKRGRCLSVCPASLTSKSGVAVGSVDIPSRSIQGICREEPGGEGEARMGPLEDTGMWKLSWGAEGGRTG